MKLLLRFLTLPVLLPFAAAAQLVTGPLPADPGRAASVLPAARATQRPAALSLPFFEDFTSPLEGAPNATRWLGATTSYPNLGTTIHYAGGGAYVSNRLAVEPLTRGTATLDGLGGNGLPYSPTVTTAAGQTDTLTSQTIDLSGFSGSSNVYLSFAWQAGSVTGYPANSTSSAPVGLTLEMLDNTGRWQSAWSFTSRGNSTKFRQQIMPLTASYLHNAFQFRFRASGSRTQNTDAFGLDYIYLNNNRTASDTTFQDIATSRGLNSPLRPYSSMPVWQYNAAAASATPPLNPTLTATVNSLTNTGQTPTPISWQGTVRALTAGGFAGTWLTGGRPIVAAARQEVVQGDATTAPLPTTTGAKRLRYQLALQTNETNPLTLPNDTTRRDVELADYYAYDDGTAEGIVGLLASNTNPTSYVALAFTTSQPDYVKALRVAPVFNNTAANDNNLARPIVVAVWADNNGKPANTPLATVSGTLTNPTPAGQTFQEITLATPVPVSGRFYVGYGQPSNGQFLNYGLDLNNQLPANTLFTNTLGAANPDPWRAVTLATPGAPMLRPVMAQTYLATRSQQAISAAFALYPNPAPTGATVAVEGPSFRQATLLDVVGRQVWQQPATEAGQATLHLPANLPGGVYLVQLALPDGSTATRQLVLQ
ncbi:MAG: T9SS type A sorting domain-containing protein [Janthinobacterium lividum]